MPNSPFLNSIEAYMRTQRVHTTTAKPLARSAQQTEKPRYRPSNNRMRPAMLHRQCQGYRVIEIGGIHPAWLPMLS
jgi:hypothetical protein